MKINLLIVITFLSIILYANIDEEHGIVGLTRLDGGVGCVCHNLDPTDSVIVWIEGPDSVLRNSAAQFKLFMTGGPAVAGGFNIASYFGLVDTVDGLTKVLFDQLTHTAPNLFQNGTVSWNFLYTAPDSVLTDTIYSVANSVNGNGNPAFDQWNFGDNFIVRVVNNIVPVELSNFSVTPSSNNVQISWTTLTETNNSGFEIERKTETTDWIKITFVAGYGTSSEVHSYTFNDYNLSSDRYYYRLKQIDYDGSINYSDVVFIEISVPSEFALDQNYPNPFNPTTKIGFHIAESEFVTLKVYDLLGNELATLVKENKPAGEYEVEFSAIGLTSGIYIYKLETRNVIQTKKMILLK